MNNNNKTIGSRYVSLKTDRQPFLDKAITASALTIPSLVLPEDYTNQTQLKTPYQSVGSRGVSHLSSKLLMALLPIGSNLMRLKAENDKDLANIEKGKIDFVFSRIEQLVTDYLDSIALRAVAFELFKQLIVAGNALLEFDSKKDECRVYSLSNYVCLRDPMGTILEVVIEEQVSIYSLSEEIQTFLESKGVIKDEERKEKTLYLYTGIRLVAEDSYEVKKEIKGFVLPNTTVKYSKDTLPFLALQFIRVSSASYGLGLVNEFIGDIQSLEALTRSIVQGSAASAKLVFLVKPNSTIRLRELQQADNGDFVHGNPDDVMALQINKQADLGIAFQTASQIEQRLAAIFLLHSSVQRQAERVTAEEVRLMAQELESSLGGIYSLLANNFQLPLVKLVLKLLEKKKQIPKIPDSINPVITTGLDALGRGQDLNKLNLFLQYLTPLGQDAIRQELNIGDYMDRLAASIGINTKGLIKTPEEKQQEAQQQQQMMQQQAMMQAGVQSAPKVADNLTKQTA